MEVSKYAFQSTQKRSNLIQQIHINLVADYRMFLAHQ